MDVKPVTTDALIECYLCINYMSWLKSAMGAAAYSKNFYPDDCHMNMDKGHSQAKVNSSKVKMVYPGL